MITTSPDTLTSIVFSLFLFMVTGDELKSSYYQIEPNLDNRYIQSSTLIEFLAESLIRCSVVCSENRKDCGCFGYNSRVQKCRLHEKCVTTQSSIFAEGWMYYCPNVSHIHKDCRAILESGQTESGVYSIYPFLKRCHPIKVYCDMKADGGGWTAFQRRLHWSQNFNRTWEDYKIGFGLPEVAYWIGNDVIHQLTKGNNSSLLIVIKFPNDEIQYELYDQFSMADEANKYRLFLRGPATGTLGDSLLVPAMDLNGMKFSAYDRDNDDYSEYNCAADFGGGWWFRSCCYLFLNFPWSPVKFSVPWFRAGPSEVAVKETLMMIRPR